ncbi:MAG: hypothetical protein AUJ19_02035 [Parcubacteria group bacterium CG1_02_58_44]|nr:MAG: hypothetical protein AUJ19_02035 [Parcubacteria group bacterium CG1_02_58_44]
MAFGDISKVGPSFRRDAFPFRLEFLLAIDKFDRQGLPSEKDYTKLGDTQETFSSKIENDSL